jgi:hypothetical protein
MTQEEKIQPEGLTLEQVKQYLEKNLRINADIEQVYFGSEKPIRLVISLSLGRYDNVISETKLIMD